MEEKFEQLANYIDEYYEVKTENDKLKKVVDEDNKQIKKLMSEIDKTEFTTDNNVTAKLTVAKKETFNEPALVEKLMELGATDAIRLIPAINWDIIEDMIYNGKLNASELAPFKEEKEVITLRINKK